MKIYKAAKVNAIYGDEVYVAVDENGTVRGYIPEALIFGDGYVVTAENCNWDDHNGERFSDFVCGDCKEV